MTPRPDQARRDRRRRLHERQAVVYGLLITILVVCSLGALAIYTGAVESPIRRDFSVPVKTSAYVDIRPPCLPNETLPVPASEVSVSILNATDMGGVARENQDILTDRGFRVTGIGNATKKEAETQIRFGVEGVAAAYTLAAHYDAPLLLLDTREGAAIDLIIGADYETPVDPRLTGLDSTVPMRSEPGCASLASITPLPGPTPPPGDEATPPAEGEPGEGEPGEGEPGEEPG